MKIKNVISNGYLKAGVLASLALSSGVFAADGAQQSSSGFDILLKQIDIAPIITGVFAVAGTVFGVSVTIMGIKKVGGMLKSF
ncbi:hypothetical protein HGO23_10075 [Xenorhabdus budapestensis]|uniref:Phage-related membrane protein n=1 Tax=Xenorhabdus budapestensis TaxID=290110 RepID=A0ABX7VHM6_XENBU|nr:hypothetical protein [Xenorhabdus budapestensis]QTL38284.1 hypothetical protein HGO23_10075 [Xenorhabdus budapestensis]